MLDDLTIKRLQKGIVDGVIDFDILLAKKFPEQPEEDFIEEICNWFSSRFMTVILSIIKNEGDYIKIRINRIIGGHLVDNSKIYQD